MVRKALPSFLIASAVPAGGGDPPGLAQSWQWCNPAVNPLGEMCPVLGDLTLPSSVLPSPCSCLLKQ